jgi:hypothetical protein
MQLINLEDLVILGQGSEWLWTMISGLVLGVTFFAIYRQLSLQRNTAAIDQVRLPTLEPETRARRGRPRADASTLIG